MKFWKISHDVWPLVANCIVAIMLLAGVGGLFYAVFNARKPTTIIVDIKHCRLGQTAVLVHRKDGTNVCIMSAISKE